MSSTFALTTTTSDASANGEVTPRQLPDAHDDAPSLRNLLVLVPLTQIGQLPAPGIMDEKYVPFWWPALLFDTRQKMIAMLKQLGWYLDPFKEAVGELMLAHAKQTGTDPAGYAVLLGVHQQDETDKAFATLVVPLDNVNTQVFPFLARHVANMGHLDFDQYPSLQHALQQAVQIDRNEFNSNVAMIESLSAAAASATDAAVGLAPTTTTLATNQYNDDPIATTANATTANAKGDVPAATMAAVDEMITAGSKIDDGVGAVRPPGGPQTEQRVTVPTPQTPSPSTKIDTAAVACPRMPPQQQQQQQRQSSSPISENETWIELNDNMAQSATTTMTTVDKNGNKHRDSGPQTKKRKPAARASARKKRAFVDNAATAPTDDTTTPSLDFSKLTYTKDKMPDFAKFIKPLLLKAGFVLKTNHYCRPQSASAAETNDVDPFASLEALRRDLCQHGVPAHCCDVWTDAQKSLVERWVRCDILTCLDEQGRLPVTEQLSNSERNELLRKLGFSLIECPLMLPGVTTPVFGVDAFHDEQDLMKHLARYGLPSNCARHMVTPEEYASLELSLTEPGLALDTFAYSRPGSRIKEWDQTSMRSTRKARNLVQHKEKLAAKAYTPKTGSEATIKLKLSTSKSVKTNSPIERKTRAKGSLTRTAASSEARRVSTESATVPPSSPSASSSRSSRSSMAIAPKLNIAARLTGLPDSFADLVKSSEIASVPAAVRSDSSLKGAALLQAAQKAVKESYEARKPVLVSGSPFVAGLHKVYDHLKDAIYAKTSVGSLMPQKGPIYVCGPSGIGKTSGIMWLVRQVLNSADLTELGLAATAGLVCINATRMCTERDAKALIMREIAKGVHGDIAKLSSHLVILVVDEIDQLVDKCHAALDEIVSLAKNARKKLVLIGISNSTGNGIFVKLKEGDAANTVIDFKPYDEKALLEIFQTRVGSAAFQPAAAELLAKSVAHHSGDVRKLLETASKSLHRTMNDGNAADTVTVRHVHAAVRDVWHNWNDEIAQLPHLGKVILCVAVALAEGGVTQTSMSRLKQLVSDCLNDQHMSEVADMSDFQTLVETLYESGLLSLGKVISSREENFLDKHVCLSVQSSDVRKAVATELKNHPVYADLTKSAKEGRGEVLFTSK